MTRDEFIAIYATHATGGYLLNDGERLRFDIPRLAWWGLCPITLTCAAETGRAHPPCLVWEAAAELGLSQNDIEDIVDAADRYRDGDCDLRRQLLRIAGVSEVLS